MKNNNMKISLDPVSEESEHEFSNHSRPSAKSTKLNKKINNDDKFPAKNFDGYVLSPVYLDGIKQEENRVVNFAKSNAFLAAPIMMINHRCSFDGDLSQHRKSICNSELSRSTPGSLTLHRSSVTSATFSGKHIWYGISLGTLIIMTTVIATLMIAWRPQQAKPEDRSRFSIDASWFIPRNKWQALEPRNKTFLSLPVPIVILGSTESPFAATYGACQSQWRKLQLQDMSKKQWNDIGFNYMVCGNGLVFEGRGSNVMGTHTRGYNARSIMIALIGEYNETTRPPQIMLDRVDLLVELLIKANQVSKKCLMLAKSFVSEDLISPSKHVLTIMKSWFKKKF